MLAGVQEILTIVLIIVCIVFIPRLFRGDTPPVNKGASEVKSLLSSRKRLWIVLSVMWPTVAGILIKPWEGHFILFFSTGVLPVAGGWAAVWVSAGSGWQSRKK